MRKYNVLHIITRFDKGGSAENTYLTLMGFDKERYNQTLVIGMSEEFTLSQREEDAVKKNTKRLKDAGIEIITIKSIKRRISPIYDITAFLRLFLLIKWRGYHIVHTHTSKAGLLGRWAACFADVPVIIHTPHGHAFTGYFGKLTTSVIIFFEKITSKITDRVITLTEGCKKDHVDFKIAPPDKFIIIHSGIETDKFNENINTAKTKDELGIKGDPLIVGTIGRLVTVKGHRYLIEAAKLIISKIPDTIFIFLGDGDLRGELEEMTKRYGIDKNVIFLGWRDDVAEVLSIFDIFALPSLNEGMGKVLVEAMLLKKPIVASKVSGVPDLVKDGYNGFLVPPEEPVILSEAILRLLTDKDKRIKMGAYGKNIANKFSAENMVSEIDDLYVSLIKTKGI